MKQTILPILLATTSSLLWFGFLLEAPTLVEPFLIHRSSSTTTTPSPPSSSSPSLVKLFAAKKKKKTKKPTAGKAAGSSFGGISMEPCPCGTPDTTYANCCGKLHRDVNAYKSATAEQVVRARYSAYAKKQPDFLMTTTHPLHKDFNTDFTKWKNTIKLNMYDNFDLNSCTILSEEYPTDDTAEVQFVANLILRETGELTAFMETSQFERAKTHGGWLYKNGTIGAAPGAEGEVADDDDTDGAEGGESSSKDDDDTVEKLREML